MRCTSCGRDWPETSKFCQSCGSELRKQAEQSKVCPLCGMVLPEDSLFCLGCGVRLGETPVLTYAPAAGVSGYPRQKSPRQRKPLSKAGRKALKLATLALAACILLAAVVIALLPTICPLAVSEDSLSVTIGESYVLTAEHTYYKNTVWSSSDTSVAYVQDGQVTGRNPGTAIITVTAGRQSVQCTVVVSPVVAAKIFCNVSSVELKIGQSRTITAVITPSNTTDKSITWSSSDSRVATVTNGQITALSEGTATITAETANGVKAACQVKVTGYKVESITLSTTSVTLKAGETETVTAAVLPENATDKTITWTSSDETVAVVSAGEITAVSAGSAVITATASSGVTVTCDVTVEAAEEPAEEAADDTSYYSSTPTFTGGMGTWDFSTNTLAGYISVFSSTDIMYCTGKYYGPLWT